MIHLDTQVPRPLVHVVSAGISACSQIEPDNLEYARRVGVDTDTNPLEESGFETRVLPGEDFVNHLGAGGNPAFGRHLAEESQEAIAVALKGSGVTILVAGLGGGTGTGAAPVVARIAERMCGAIVFTSIRGR